MKRYLLSGLTIVLSTLAIASAANAGQTNLNDPAADLNGDGVVTIGELVMHNRDQRQS
ncbi:hypothetical protein IQ254_15415 [Nodosilinea sp. LEGE 07088]|uniref:hypothetical protein n=1 Tax=Nodosilinea sp. LEGE 07088 TaxID=2777968 RepID=UPI0018825692|nr:hypothetical protein [Nodosilinea sp. LEGE 07088]MBE9138563.1 hypothetical protein [Nodosilinea sp. LEGE 07088]